MAVALGGVPAAGQAAHRVVAQVDPPGVGDNEKMTMVLKPPPRGFYLFAVDRSPNQPSGPRETVKWLRRASPCANPISGPLHLDKLPFRCGMALVGLV